ncbi:MAG: hypothetical protein ACYS29_08500, partial [Planctomycetota bacterium]
IYAVSRVTSFTLHEPNLQGKKTDANRRFLIVGWAVPTALCHSCGGRNPFTLYAIRYTLDAKHSVGWAGYLPVRSYD